ncbi:MAG: hypothetical protein JXR68_02000 [Bacteroidales bacterium]|nr:hypothetical protein [Bacteroidales bacterium]
MKTKIFIFIFIFASNYASFAQTLLQKQISIPQSEYKITELLTIIEQKANFRFSYNSNLVDNSTIISYSAKNKTVEECLNDIFNNSVKYKTSGKYIILLDNSNQQNDQKQKFVVQGKITTSDDKPIPNVSIYDVNNQQSTITKDDGTFSLTVNSADDFSGLSIGKYGFLDTAIIYNYTLNEPVNIELKAKDTVFLTPIGKQYNNDDDFNFLKYVKSFVPENVRINSQNLNHIVDTKAFQISLIPGISSNLSNFGVLKNKVSINVLIGYSRGVENFELAGLINIDKEDVQWLQLAGLTNLVGGNVNGVQIGGIANAVNGQVNGFQAGGIANFAKDEFSGVQTAGILNFNTNDFDGAQTAGVINTTIGDFDGTQIGGVTNFTFGKFDGFQCAGVLNIAFNQFNGTQIAGVLNATKNNFNGVQISGVANFVADTLNGGQISGVWNVSQTSNFQIAGVLNTTLNNKGIQIALFNYADTSSGVSIGLISFVRKGYNKPLISANEVLNLNFNFHIGTEKFYNIFSIGYQPAKELIWGLGYGFGHKINFNNWANFDIELTTKTLNYNTLWNKEWFVYSNLAFIWDFRIKNNISLYLGPTINFYLRDKTKNSQTLEYLSSTYNYPIYHKEGNNLYSKSWIGFYFGLSL